MAHTHHGRDIYLSSKEEFNIAAGSSTVPPIKYQTSPNVHQHVSRST